MYPVYPSMTPCVLDQCPFLHGEIMSDLPLPCWVVVSTPLKNIAVHWDGYSQYVGKYIYIYKIHVPVTTNQLCFSHSHVVLPPDVGPPSASCPSVSALGWYSSRSPLSDQKKPARNAANAAGNGWNPGVTTPGPLDLLQARIIML